MRILPQGKRRGAHLRLRNSDGNLDLLRLRLPDRLEALGISRGDGMNTEIILEALNDYYRWFDSEEDEDDAEMRMRITQAIKDVKALGISKEKESEKKFFPVTSIHKDDIRTILSEFGEKKIRKQIEARIFALSDDDMKEIAGKLENSYLNCCFWDSLKWHFLTYPCSKSAKKVKA